MARLRRHGTVPPAWPTPEALRACLPPAGRAGGKDEPKGGDGKKDDPKDGRGEDHSDDEGKEGSWADAYPPVACSKEPCPHVDANGQWSWGSDPEGHPAGRVP